MRHGILVRAFVGLATVTAVLLPAHPSRAESPAPDRGASAEPLSEPWIDIEQLSTMRVVSVSREDHSLFRTPAAVTLLTTEDILQTGATSLPEALRWVPGLNVAQISSNTWAVGARGFQWQYANKMLVMIDGRSVYSVTTGGVRWEDISVFLDDVDRIEIVRGPGSSIWGANAVNGVISVVSKNAFETQGTRIVAAAGNELRAHVGLRHGLQLSDRLALRINGQYQQLDDNTLPAGGSADDGARMAQGGFRLDWRPTDADDVTWQGDGFVQNTEYVRNLVNLDSPPTYSLLSQAPVRAGGGNLLARWRHRMPGDSYLEARGYWDHLLRDRPQTDEALHTFDGEIVFGTAWAARQHLTSGLGYRLIDGAFAPELLDHYYSVSHLRTHLFSAFAQDEISLVPERLDLTLGAKVEHNSFTGWEPQPTVRLAGSVSPDIVVWGSAARAIRTPTWNEELDAFDAHVSPPASAQGLPTVLRVFGNHDLRPEKLTAYEVGARWKSPASFSCDVAAFYYTYADYVMVSDRAMTTQAFPPAQVRETQFDNGITGTSFGGELSGHWNPAAPWQFQASYSYVRIDLSTTKSDPFQYQQDEDTTPRHAVRLQSAWRPSPTWELNIAARYVSAVPYYSVAAYPEVDARVAWEPARSWQIAVVGHNLVHAHHPEYDSAVWRKMTELDRALHLAVRWAH